MCGSGDGHLGCCHGCLCVASVLCCRWGRLRRLHQHNHVICWRWPEWLRKLFFTSHLSPPSTNHMIMLICKFNQFTYFLPQRQQHNTLATQRQPSQQLRWPSPPSPPHNFKTRPKGAWDAAWWDKSFFFYFHYFF